MTSKLDFLRWLDDQEGYYIRRDKVTEEFPDLGFDLTGVTMKMDDENILIPKRDYRQAITHGQALD